MLDKRFIVCYDTNLRQSQPKPFSAAPIAQPLREEDDASMTLNFGLPTHEDTVKAVNYTEAHILDAILLLEPQVEYRVASRELNLTRTKLQEALMWLRESTFYVPEIKSPNHPYPYRKQVTGTSLSHTEGQANNAPQHHHRVDDDPPSE